MLVIKWPHANLKPDAFFMENYFINQAEAENHDFMNDGEGSRQAINKWVEDQTNKKIKDLLPPNSIDELTALILVNAVYFKVCSIGQ